MVAGTLQMISFLSLSAIARAEQSAQDLYRQSGLCPSKPASPGALCRALLGRGPRYMPRLKVEACLAWVVDGFQVWVRTGTAPARARWLVCHELAEWCLRDLSLPNLEKEQLCDALGAALIAPRPAFLKGLRRSNDDPVSLAPKLHTTTSLALLRHGEVTGRPVALIRHNRAVVRGDRFAWPCPLTIDGAARLRSGRCRRIEIDDEPGRVALVAA
jgi:hypothetical protein